MKRSIAFILILSLSLCLVGCYQDLESDSLEEYLAYIDRYGLGKSVVEIDHPDYFLPSCTFLKDYNYEEGSYYWYEEDPIKELFTKELHPNICILALKYDKEIYLQAKQFMQEAIPPYNDTEYIYNDYVFYENANFVELKGSRQFPKYFTMACHNDKKCVLLFIGMYAGTTVYKNFDEKYIADPEENWESFIDTYYGQHYDFT